VIDDQADEAEVDVDGREKLRSASSAGGSLSTRGCAKMVRASAKKLAEVRKRRSIYGVNVYIHNKPTRTDQTQKLEH
jgi:hypothetical protein